MISIVLVSHSSALAAGVKELAEQMTHGRVGIFSTGGLDEHTLGTNVETILRALTEADNSDGTLVLMDLGSAILSTETALELLSPEARGRVRLCPAPLVEGSVAAAVQAALGSDLETVYHEALTALNPKLEQLGQSPPASTVQPASLSGAPAGESLILTLINPQGLHARPAARLVELVSGFDADVTITDLTTGRGPVSARSILGVVALAAEQGHQVRLDASGPQSAAVLSAIQSLIQGNIEEM